VLAVQGTTWMPARSVTRCLILARVAETDMRPFLVAYWTARRSGIEAPERDARRRPASIHEGNDAVSVLTRAVNTGRPRIASCGQLTCYLQGSP
jgi:hypothetical protein